MFACCALHAQIYKWTDSQGVIHFSDKPHQGSQTVKIPEPQIYSPLDAVPNENAPPAKASQGDHVYNSVSIAQPTDQATIRNNQGYVVVATQLDPSLMEGDTLQLIFGWFTPG